jgi:large subunit ribosomal protein L44e
VCFLIGKLVVIYVNVPKEVNTYCPKCKDHTIHAVTLYKAGKRRALAVGERHHEREKKVMADKNIRCNTIRKNHQKTNSALEMQNMRLHAPQRWYRLRKLAIV